MPENIPAPTAQEITLREHIEGRIAAQAAHLSDAIRSVEESAVERQAALRREIELVQRASREAVDKAEEAQKLRNEAMNEWRQTVTTIIARYVEQRQLDTLDMALRSKIESLEKAVLSKLESEERSIDNRLKVLETKGSGQAGWVAGPSLPVASCSHSSDWASFNLCSPTKQGHHVARESCRIHPHPGAPVLAHQPDPRR